MECVFALLAHGYIFTDDDDYSVNNRQLAFFSQYNECTTVTLENDTVLEDEEYVILSLQPASNADQFIAVLPRHTVINIQDDDGKRIRSFCNVALKCKIRCTIKQTP